MLTRKMLRVRPEMTDIVSSFFNLDLLSLENSIETGRTKGPSHRQLFVCRRTSAPQPQFRAGIGACYLVTLRRGLKDHHHRVFIRQQLRALAAPLL